MNVKPSYSSMIQYDQLFLFFFLFQLNVSCILFKQEPGDVCVEAVLLRPKVSDDAGDALQPSQPDADKITPVRHHGSLPHAQYR